MMRSPGQVLTYGKEEKGKERKRFADSKIILKKVLNRTATCKLDTSGSG